MTNDLAPVITCSGLLKRYGRKNVLKGVDLSVPSGEVFALLGTNGAGKTTLIRTILGLIPRSGGQVDILGEDPWQSGAALRARIGYVSEEQGLYGWMRISQLIAFCRSLYPKWNQELVDDYLNRFSLSPEVRIRTMSKGQKVRLALILALAPEPELLILDEPMSGLDPLAQHEFLRIIQEVAVKEGRTIFFSTHNLPDVEAIASQVAILYDGKVQITGSLEEIRQSIKKVQVRNGLDTYCPPGIVCLEMRPESAVYLVPNGIEGWEQASSTGIGMEVIQEEPASLQEVFLYYCSGREGNAVSTTAS